MSEYNSSNYMGAFIGSLIGGIMILADDFAAWDASNYYLKVYAQGWVWLDSTVGFLTLGPLCGFLLFVAYQSFRGTKKPLEAQKLQQVYKISLSCLIASLAFALLFIVIISGEEVEDWWFEGGFYGSAIGSLISTLALRNEVNANRN